MLIKLSEATTAEGTAAANSAKIADGFVLTHDAMLRTLDERLEQINSLLHAINPENISRVSADLKRTILTVRVPHDVEKAVAEAFDQLEKPIIMRLSPIGAIKNPLKPTIVMSIEDKKSALDALRMLYAEMFTVENLSIDIDISAAIIIQTMPDAAATYKVIKAGENTIIEAQHGFGAWVNYAESDRFLFENDELKVTEHGDSKGLFGMYLDESDRVPVTMSEAKDMYAYCKTLFPNSPLLVARLDDKSFYCLGCSAALPE